ncbi:adenosylcobinamide-phosphate synthase CbiB [uncultured Tyzzerella sp.]|uniref:adenosylcobinamide-phosphate synthase CbiB n=1 Tax=uncultured Tyzzerella sp. TaxID=2321398 RepID=UPI002941EF89|nr:adenosylcobinamide-phosphate synthase CbiB [uncultured Tyzzerella sp.]
MVFKYAIIIGFIIDCILGDPQNPLHPIRLLGYINNIGIKIYDNLNIKKAKIQFIYGIIMNISILVLVFLFCTFLVKIFYSINFYLGIIFESIMSYFIIAPKCLYTESMKIYKELKNNNIKNARVYLSYIVGRDTENLEEEKIVKATVETISENLSDGVIAPLIFLAIGGVPLGMVYKAINTLDSMIGYKNEKFIYFGRFSAKLDDFVNFIPARISAIFMIIASFLARLNYKNAIKIYIRDRYNHLSPNSAQTESVCAGALGIQLGGTSTYKGKIVEKKTIGDSLRKANIEDIVLANKLMYISTIIYVIILLIIWW